ncbi:MAG: hypothetical protein IJV69_06885 [Kiritimatiellae bacterium]|nr:hypothetical protein [Kiritimatiellia bacterium]
MKCLTLLSGLFISASILAAPLKVACIGDSITYGTGLKNRDAESYPSQLQQLLGAEYEVRNFGNPGRGIYLHSWRGRERRGYRYMAEHQAALAWQPDIVICNLGINDNGEFLKRERVRPGAFAEDYLLLLADYQALPTKPKLYIWGKLAPLAPGQNFYRSPEPFLMQPELAKVAATAHAQLIDMQEPLRPYLTTAFPDKIHPSAEGAKIIAETVYKALTTSPEKPVALPEDIAETAEVWLCAGQSNMFWKLGWCAQANQEAAETANYDIRLWDFMTRKWHKITPQNAKEWSAMGVSFAIRRAKASGKPIALLYVAAGGAPTEAFLSEEVMAAINRDGKPLYPNLLKIVTNRKQIHENEDFPCKWCAREYPKRKNNKTEAHWWALNKLYRDGIAKIRHLPLTGILWYQGESNATVNVAPDKPLADDYMLETLLAVIDTLRPSKETPFLMVGLPVMNRPWEPYRTAQQKACQQTGAIYLDTFSAGLGEKNNVHPTNKIPFVEMAAEAAAKVLD